MFKKGPGIPVYASDGVENNALAEGMVVYRTIMQRPGKPRLVDHLNRNIAMCRETTRAVDAAMKLLADDHRAFIEYQTQVIVYLQKITAYIDTKDRYALAVAFHDRRDAIEREIALLQRGLQSLKRHVEAEPGGSVAPGASAAAGASGASGGDRAWPRAGAVCISGVGAGLRLSATVRNPHHG